MNDLTHIPQQQAVTAPTDGAVAPYHDRVFHTYRTSVSTDTLCSDPDYYIGQRLLRNDSEEHATRIFIRDIRTHQLLKTVDIVIRKGRFWSAYALQYFVIRKAESDKSILLLNATGNNRQFLSIDMQSDGTAYTTHSLQSGSQQYAVYSHNNELFHYRPLYCRGKIYYISTTRPHDPDHPGTLSLHWFQPRTGEDYTYPGELFKPNSKETKMIAADPDTGRLIVYCNALGVLTQINTADDTIIARSAVPNEDPYSRFLFPSMHAGRMFFVSNLGIIRYVDLQTGAPVFTVDLKSLLDQLSGGEDNPFFWHIVHQIAVNGDESCLAVVCATLNRKYFLIFDMKKQTLALQCNLMEHQAFPLYCKSKLETLGFSGKTAARMETAVQSLYFRIPFHSPADLLAHPLHKTDLPVAQTPPGGEPEEAGFRLYPTSRSLGNATENDVVLHACRMPSKAEVDTLDLSNRVLTGRVEENEYTWPALLYQEKYRSLDNRFLATVSRQGRIEIIEHARNIADISGEYIARRSADDRKLILYTREHVWVTSIALNPGRLFYRARFSRKNGCINIYYYKPCFIERYAIARYASGDRQPEAAVQIPDSFHYPFPRHNRESRDGRLLYQIYIKENLHRWLKVTDMETGEVRSDLPLPGEEITVYHIESVDMGDPVITLSCNKHVYYVNAFTMDILATLYLYQGGRFLIIACEQSREGRYFYTNAPELVSVYEKDLCGQIRLLEKGDSRRVQYLRVYNSQKKVHDLIYNPAQFRQQQQRLQALLRLCAAGHSLPDPSGAGGPRLLKP